MKRYTLVAWSRSIFCWDENKKQGLWVSFLESLRNFNHNFSLSDPKAIHSIYTITEIINRNLDFKLKIPTEITFKQAEDIFKNDLWNNNINDQRLKVIDVLQKLNKFKKPKWKDIGRMNKRYFLRDSGRFIWAIDLASDNKFWLYSITELENFKNNKFDNSFQSRSIHSFLEALKDNKGELSYNQTFKVLNEDLYQKFSYDGTDWEKILGKFKKFKPSIPKWKGVWEQD